MMIQKNTIVSNFSDELLNAVSRYLSYGFNCSEIAQLLNKNYDCIRHIKADIKNYYLKQIEEKK